MHHNIRTSHSCTAACQLCCPVEGAHVRAQPADSCQVTMLLVAVGHHPTHSSAAACASAYIYLARLVVKARDAPVVLQVNVGSKERTRSRGPPSTKSITRLLVSSRPRLRHEPGPQLPTVAVSPGRPAAASHASGPSPRSACRRRLRAG